MPSNDLDALSDLGWHVQKSAKYRYDVVPVEDWYAEIDEPPEAGNAWFELELGIVVNRKRVPLLPVLVQLIRNAPLDFNPEVLAAHARKPTRCWPPCPTACAWRCRGAA